MSTESAMPFAPLVRKVETKISSADGGRALLPWLAGHFLYLDEAGWREQLQAGRLLVNGTAAGEDCLLREGDLLEFIPRGLQEPPVDWNIRIVFAGGDYLVVDKPGCLPCHPAGAYFNHTLWAWLKQVRGMENIYFVNRLDRETSGLVLIAGNSAAASAASAALRAPSAVREYLVLTEGLNLPEYVMADGWLGPAQNSPVRKKRQFYGHREDVPSPGKAETAKTEFFRMAEDAASGLTLLKARLHTGRTHQIRATLWSLGFPVAGDKLYGPDDRLFLKWIDDALTEEDRRKLRFPRQALHACRLQVDLPGVPVHEFTAELPDGFPPFSGR